MRSGHSNAGYRAKESAAMKLLRWWINRNCFGFAFYLNQERNPTFGFSKSYHTGGVFVGRRSYQWGYK